MCGRFSLIAETRQLLDYYGLVNADRFTGSRFNIAPGQNVAAVIAVEGERHLEYFHWGLIPFWAKDRKFGYSTINARAETVATKPAFRHAFLQHRCIIPADGFYEWQGREGHKQPWRIEPQDRHALFSFAGLWEVWEGGGEVIRSCTIIVGVANEAMKPIHERMPVLLPRASWKSWLDMNTDSSTLQSIINTPSEQPIRCYRVGTHVNNPRNDDADCLVPLGAK
jgi:putative SOS response-associated peptidase YedK